MPQKSSKILKTTILPAAYQSLFNGVRKILLEGQRRIEEERVRTYWETGRLIHSHILKYADHAEYGAQVILNLAKDLNVDKTVLNRCLQFHQKYPRLRIVAGRQQFKWSHYRQLMTVSDHKRRLFLEKKAVEKRWTAQELAIQIKENHPPEKKAVEVQSTPQQSLLTPLRGKPYTYQIIDRPNVQTGKSSGLRVDLGFGVFHKAAPALLSQFNKGDIVESRPKEDAYQFYKIKGGPRDLYTYWAEVEKVIDGDTLKVRFDLGFDVEIREVLRLRGLDCPEVNTKEGKEVKAFVQSHIKEAQMIVVRSSRSDKYDRYLADVFIPQGEEPDPATEVYLNNLLLETGRAKRVK